MTGEEEELRKARKALEAAENRMTFAKEVARRATLMATRAGISESEIARALGVNRLTVRRWLGK